VAELLSELLERCRRNDPDAVGTLVCRFRAWAHDLAESFLGDEHLAEDAVQAAFVRALTRLAELRQPSAFPGWFRQVVRTECLRIGRKRRATETLSHDAACDADAPPSNAESEERNRLVGAAMQTLSPATRQTAELFYWDQCPCAEVARRLGIPAGTVKRRLHDARMRLRQLLPDYDETPRPQKVEQRRIAQRRLPL
jgi:RNA polymerase sigma factor (sigma-70 family)